MKLVTVKVFIVLTSRIRQTHWLRNSVCLFVGLFPFLGWSNPPEGSQNSSIKQLATDEEHATKDARWKPLTESWEACEFGGDGPIEITKSLIQVGYGDPLTGVRWKDAFPKDSFEVEVEARRTDGFDFFCALTFPVAESHCTLVLGGWGGGVMGLSSIDGYDASENETTQFRNFEDNHWYRVRVRVEPEKITCWVNDQVVVEQSREGHKFGIRFEMDPCVPLGLAAYQCNAEYRNLRWRPLAKASQPAEAAKK